MFYGQNQWPNSRRKDRQNCSQNDIKKNGEKPLKMPPPPPFPGIQMIKLAVFLNEIDFFSISSLYGNRWSSNPKKNPGFFGIQAKQTPKLIVPFHWSNIYS
jgi:hypothetical protein